MTHSPSPAPDTPRHEDLGRFYDATCGRAYAMAVRLCADAEPAGSVVEAAYRRIWESSTAAGLHALGRA